MRCLTSRRSASCPMTSGTTTTCPRVSWSSSSPSYLTINITPGKITVPSIDDKEDMQFADEAYDILGFTKEEKYNVYKVSHSSSSHLSLSYSYSPPLLTFPFVRSWGSLRIRYQLDIWGFQVLMGRTGPRGPVVCCQSEGTLLWYLGATRLNRLTQHNIIIMSITKIQKGT